MDAEIGDASGKGELRHIRHQHLETGGDLEVTDEISPGPQYVDDPLHPGLLALACSCRAMPGESPDAQELAQQFRIDDEAFLLGQRFLQTRHAVAGVLFDEPTQHRALRLVLLRQAFLRLLTLVKGLLADA